MLALVTPPWYGILTPPTAAAALAAFVRARTSAQVECHHPFLHVADRLGHGLYRSIQETPFGGLLGSVLCFDMDRERAAHVIHAHLRTPGYGRWRPMRERLRAPEDVRLLLGRVEATLLDWFGSIDWGRYDLIGFSNSSAQLFFSLFLVTLLRRQGTAAAIVLGGSECSPAVARNLAATFPHVDAIVSGEGEVPLVRLVELLQRHPRSWRGLVEQASAPSQLRDLGELPVPDYDDFFAELARTTIAAATREHLEPIVEVGRGCYWSRTVPAAPQHRGCAFCGEKHLWNGYRHKPAARVAAEVSDLVSRHDVSRVYLGDSGLQPRLATEIFRRMRDAGMALDISLNVRPNVPPELFELFEECGVRHITIGFEALSTGALNVMNKGTQAIDVLYMLKKCEQHGIRHDGKLICHHPGVPPADLEVQLRNLEFAKWYAPLQPNAFQLIAGSAIHAAPSEFGVSEVGNHPSYRPLMPDWAFEGLDLFRKHFVDHNRATTYPLWNRIEARLLAWAAAYHRLRSVDDTPLLRACATGSSLEIRSRELVGDEVLSKTLRLTEQAARLYRACDVPVRRDELASSTGTSAAEVSAVLDKLVESRVVFREGERYLALAIEDGGRR